MVINFMLSILYPDKLSEHEKGSIVHFFFKRNLLAHISLIVIMAILK